MLQGFFRRWLWLTALLVVVASRAEEPNRDKPLDAATVEFFEKRIRPLLAERCWSCHGEDQAESDLRLDSRALMLEGGSRGAAITPGDPDKSLLIRAVNHADTLQMPPKAKLAVRDINDLTTWLKMGAPWPNSPTKTPTPKKSASQPDATTMQFSDEQKTYWAFQPVTNPSPPRANDGGWGQSPVDRFIFAELKSRGLSPAPLADQRTLIRRATFDLHGVPPTPDEVAEFIADDSLEAFARVIDRLLASPRYGQRWGRHWLDVARYGDSNGLDENLAHANAFRYRDWTINAFNRDLPFDQFIQQQLAGDLLPIDGDPNDPDVAKRASERLTATGFLVIGAKMLAEDDPLKMQMDIVDEQIDTLGKAFLGITLGCARCHDHKFDPISMADYYSLAGIFKSTKTMLNFNVVARWQERPLASPAQLQRLTEAQQLVTAKQNEINQLVQHAQQQVLTDARRRVADYVMAAAREIYFERTTKSFGDTFDRREDKSSPPPDGVQIIESENYQRGTAIKLNTGYGEGIGVILSHGSGDWWAEYDIAVPKPGTYQIEARYAALDSRSAKLSLNGEVIKPNAFKDVTGSWNPDTQRWHIEGRFEFKAGVNVLRLERREPLPHIDKLLVARVELPSAGIVAPTIVVTGSGLHAAFIGQWKRFLKKSAADPNSPFTAWRAVSRQPFDDSAAELFNVAAQTGAELRQAADAWDQLKASESGKSATELANLRQESLRKVLFDASDGAPFALPKIVEDVFGAETKIMLEQRRADLKPLQAAVPKFPEAMAVSEGKVEDLPIHFRGNHTTLANTTQPRRFPRIFGGDKLPPLGPDRSGRLELARWLTEPTNPLTARVAVNRVWLWHFGEGLVRSPDNFGLLGQRPTHPEMLDWLSQQFTGSGWSIKNLHRAIMLSSTYQMQTTFREDAFLADPDNRLWWRRNRRRLEVEAIRDSLLAVSGKLDNTFGGSQLPTANRAYVTGTANFYPQIYDSHRRSVYLPVVRSALYDVFQVFDFAEPSVMSGQRDSTTIATQALFMLNSALVAEQSRELASRLLALANADNVARVRHAYQIVLQRDPSSLEIDRALAFVQRLAAMNEPPKNANDSGSSAWRSFCRALLGTNEFLYVE